MQNQTNPTASQLISAAIAAAGKTPAIVRALDVKAATVCKWARVGRIPAHYIKPLCDLGGNVVSSTAILEALAREASEKAAA